LIVELPPWVYSDPLPPEERELLADVGAPRVAALVVCCSGGGLALLLPWISSSQFRR
jgi:hypothetical protein